MSKRTFPFRRNDQGLLLETVAPLPLFTPPPSLLTHEIDLLELKEPIVIGDPTPNNKIGIKAPNLLSSYSVCMPIDEGTPGQHLTTDGLDPAQLTWVSAAGDVMGPAGAVNESIARFDGVTGKLLKDSVVTITDGGVILGVATLNGVVVESHASRHLPSGSDAITTTAPLLDISSSTTNDVGTADSFARSDHQHAIDISGFNHVVGPVSATDTALARYNGTTGKIIENSGAILDDSNELTGLTGLEILHVAAENDDSSVRIQTDTNGFADVRGLEVLHDTDALADLQAQAGILVNIDESDSKGGRVFGMGVIATGEGSAIVDGLVCGVGVNPILQFSGSFANASSLSNDGADVLAALSSGGGGGITTFIFITDFFTVGSASKYSQIEFILATPASGGGIAPVFEYSTGSGPTTFAFFTPTDNTSGFRNTGTIVWSTADIPLWVVGDGAEFFIRITRTRNTVNTDPVMDLVQVSAATEFGWDRDGKVVIDTLDFLEPGGLSTISFTAPSLAADVNYTLPIDDGDSGNVLETDGTGVLSWETPGASGLPTGYVEGLLITNSNNAAKIIASGSCRSSDDTEDLVFAGGNVSINTSGAGGLDTGSESSNTWYALFIIGGGGNAVDTLMSLSATSPTLPGTYTVQRRIGWTRNDNMSNFYDYYTSSTSRDRFYMWIETLTTLELLTNGSASTFTNVDISELVPPTSTQTYMSGEYTGGNGDFVSLRPDGSSITPVAHRMYSAQNSSPGSSAFFLETNTSQVIEYSNNTTAKSTDLWVLGYTDSL